MFQSTEIKVDFQRPPSLHAYAEAKVYMDPRLQLLKKDGWAPLAAAMLRANLLHDFRPVTGTSLNIRILPTVLSVKEELLLLLSRWSP